MARILTFSGIAAPGALLSDSTSPAISAGEKHVISQKGKSFSVSELHVKVGDTVAFKNDDDVSHNVFSVSKVQPFNTKMQTPGTEAAVTFTTEGTIEVRKLFRDEDRPALDRYSALVRQLGTIAGEKAEQARRDALESSGRLSTPRCARSPTGRPPRARTPSAVWSRWAR